MLRLGADVLVNVPLFVIGFALEEPMTCVVKVVCPLDGRRIGVFKAAMVATPLASLSPAYTPHWLRWLWLR